MHLRAVLLSITCVFACNGAQVTGPPVKFAGWNRVDPASFGDGQPASYTRLTLPVSAIVTPAGAVTIGGPGAIRQIGPDGRMSTLLADENIAGLIAAGRDGIVYYQGFGDIHVLTPTGAHPRIAGLGNAVASDGLAAADSMVDAIGLAVNANGSLYFSDAVTRRVWRIDSAGVLRAVAGTDSPGTAGEGGLATNAQLEFPVGLAFDTFGALYILDANRILQVRQDGTLRRLNVQAPIQGSAFAVDASGNVYFAGQVFSQIQRLAPDGTVSLFAGTPEYGFSNGCGSATTARFGQVASLAVDSAGNVLVIDQLGPRLREITPRGEVFTLAGAPPSLAGDGGQASAATFGEPRGLTFDHAGSLYIADTGNHRIRKVTADGIIRTIAGDGGPTGDADYACAASNDAFLHSPEAVAVDASGNLFIADTGKHRVMRLAPDGTLSRFAGTGVQGFAIASVGMEVNSLPLDSPRALGVDRNGNVWIGDNARRTLKISPDGKIATILPRLRARSFSTDARDNLYLSASFVSYLVGPNDELTPLAGVAQALSIPIAPPPPVEEPDANDTLVGSGFTRDAQGALYNVTPTGVDLFTPGCTASQVQPSQSFAGSIGPWHVAASPQGDVYLSDTWAGVVWRLPHVTAEAGDLPTPQLAQDAPVTNAASMLISTIDLLLTTGSSSSALYRFIVSDDIAAGEIVRVAGQCLGPLAHVAARYDGMGQLPTSLGGTNVTFGGLPAPLIDVQAGAIVAIVPASLPAGQDVQMAVTVEGVSVSQMLHSTQHRPGLFHFLDPDDTSAVIAIHTDGSVNSQSNPAAIGSIVELFATGLGDVASSVGMTINGVAADVLYAVPAPGFLGLSQINVRIPQTSSGPVILSTAGVAFKQVVQIWIGR